MATKQSISCKSENEQYSQKCSEEDNISINILNDDCLGHIFKCLPIADRFRSERGEYSTLYIYFIYHILQDRYRYFFSAHIHIYTYIFYFYYYSLQTLEGGE